MIGLLAFAHLVAASELGGLIGFVAIWAMIFAIVPIEAAAGLIPGLQKNVSLPSWTPEAVLSAAGLAIIAAAARKLVKAGAARRAGDHNEARRRAFSGLSIASVPTCLILSVKALADAWP
jgi:hypothetical protein